MAWLEQPPGCAHPINADQDVVTFPACLGGMVELSCQACQHNPHEALEQPSLVAQFCDGDHMAWLIDETGKERILATAGGSLLTLVAMKEQGQLPDAAHISEARPITTNYTAVTEQLA